MRFYKPVQHLPSLPCFRNTRTLAQTAQMMAIYANAIQSHTISSAPAMRARESRGFRALLRSDDPG